jgi:ADP-heptose:LPS heptosyltransferase
MGWGDELMAAGQAARVSRETGRRVAILDRQGIARVHELWQDLDFISGTKGPDIETIVNGPGCRPYIDYPFSIEGGQRFTGWRARDHRPVIARSLAERQRGDFILIEPTIKQQANPNKFWRRWQEVVDAMPGATFVQCRPRGDKSGVLRGVRVVETSTFVEAVQCLAGAAAYVGHEGGMHHAAAALNVPAVVVFGGAPSIEATGYPDHFNIGTDEPCGRWLPCSHCAEIMNAITPEQVVQAVKEALQ